VLYAFTIVESAGAHIRHPMFMTEILRLLPTAPEAGAHEPA